MDKTKAKSIKSDVEKLAYQGLLLYYKLALECGELDYHEDYESYEESAYKKAQEKKKKDKEAIVALVKDLRDFNSEFEIYYSQALKTVSVFSPERLEDFKRQYRDEKRKKLEFSTYTISDAIIGIKNEYANFSRSSALPRMYTQHSILDAIAKNIEAELFDLEGLLRADMFDSELDAAEHLLNRKHVRAAGAVAGVVLESHLGVVARRHGYSSKKKNPTISDFNDHLKSEAVIDTATWRRIQSYGDIRNNCDHAKGTAPKVEDVSDLISGIRRVSKELF